MSEVHSGVKFKHRKVGELVFDSIIKESIEKLISTMANLPEDCFKDVAGNISVRLDEGILISTSGSKLQCLQQEEDFSKVVSDGYDNIVSYYGKNIPSSETKMHLLIYKNRPEVDFCIHVHLPNIQKIQLLNRFSVTSKFLSYGTFDLAKETVKSLGSGDIAVLRDHGIVVVGNNLKSITGKIIQIRNI